MTSPPPPPPVAGRPIAHGPGEVLGADRLAAFSDGVFAVIITIMVLEMKVPSGSDWAALVPLAPVFLAYVLSYVYVGTYWNNHHHLLKAARRVSGAALWANLHLLFWLSLLPVATGWLGANPHAAAPAALYGVVLLGAALAYYVLQQSLIRAEGPHALLRRAVGRDWKGKVSPLLYLAAIALSFRVEALSLAIYALVAALWLVPDRRIEMALREPAGR